MDETNLIQQLALHPVFPKPEHGSFWHGAMVAGAYLIQTITVVLIMVRGWRRKSYGMPLFGVVAVLGLCMISGFFGPWLLPNLFHRLTDVPTLLWAWRAWTVFMGVVFFQCVFYGRKQAWWPEYQRYYVPFAFLMLILVTYAEWNFILFYQDVYINEVWPLVMLVMAVSYLSSFFKRHDLKGLSVWVAWGWAVSNILLYGAVVLGDMNNPYPCHNGVCDLQCSKTRIDLVCQLPAACEDENCALQLNTGYGFMYLTYAVTIGLNLAYAVGLTVRRRETSDDWDTNLTLRRMLPKDADLPPATG